MTSATHPVRFCTTPDGVRIAFATGGDGLPIVKTPNWLNHVELDPKSVVWQPWIAEMSRHHLLVRYDARGCGLSDREIEHFSFATNLLDLEAVVDAAGLRRFALFGASQGAAIAIAFAARHPDRVSHLIIHGGYLRGVMKRGAPPGVVEEAQTMLKLIELGWGKEDSAFRQVFATQFIPDSTLEQLRAFDEIQRRTASPETAARLLRSYYDIDVADVAGDVACPTLVMHCRGDRRIPFEEGRRVAAAIKGAEFVPLDSPNHIVLAHQPAWRQYFDEIAGFFRRHGIEAPRAAACFLELTGREREVLELIASGLDNERIASRLGLSAKTVRNHINHIFSKLSVPNRAQAIVRARDAGFGQQDRPAGSA